MMATGLFKVSQGHRF